MAHTRRGATTGALARSRRHGLDRGRRRELHRGRLFLLARPPALPPLRLAPVRARRQRVPPGGSGTVRQRHSSPIVAPICPNVAATGGSFAALRTTAFEG